MADQRFPIRLGGRSMPLLRLLWGVMPGLAYADVGQGPDGAIKVRFGRVRFAVTLANIESWRIEGPWLWITAIGVRRSLRGGDLSFAGSPKGGVRLDFRAPVKWFVFHVPALYVGADDLDGMAAALRGNGVPGVDARKVRG